MNDQDLTEFPRLTSDQLLQLLTAVEREKQDPDTAWPDCFICHAVVLGWTATLGTGSEDERVVTFQPCGHRMTYSVRVGELLAARAEAAAAIEATDPATPVDEMAFFTRVMEMFYLADVREDLIWHVTDGKVHLAANVSDIFAWGGADSEAITPDTLPVLEQAWQDVRAIGQEFLMASLYAARVRGMRPQGAAYPQTVAAQELFNACGPEREVGLGNPRPVPAAVDQPKKESR